MNFSIDDDGFVDNGEASFHLNDVQAHHKAVGTNGELVLVFVLTGNNLVVKLSDEAERDLIYKAVTDYKKMLFQRTMKGIYHSPMTEPMEIASEPEAA